MPRSKRDIPEYRLRRHDNGTWYVHWSEARRTKRATTGTEDKAEAQRYLADFAAARHGPPEDPTVSSILDGYLDDRDGIAIAHKRLVEAAVPLRTFFGHMTPRQVTPAHTRAYGKMRGVMPGTVIKELKTLRAALNWALRREWIDRVPFVEMPAAPQPRARWLNREEFALLLDGCGAPHLRLYCLIAVHTFARKTSILELTWQQVDFETGLVDFNAPDRPITKKRRAVVPMNVTLRAAIEDARQLARTDHVIEYNGRPIVKINDSFRRACQRAGLDDVTPHDLRRTGGTWAAMAGIDLNRIAEMMGHDDIGITRRVYAKYHPDYLRDVVEALEG